MFWTSSRVTRFSTSVLLSLIISCVIAAFSDESSKSLLYRGDFPAFYTAAYLADQGRLKEIYDEPVEQNLQKGFWPSLSGEFYAFSYPPYVAQLLAPLSRLSPSAAKLLFTSLMFLAVFAAIALCGTVIPEVAGAKLVAFTACLSFAPLFIGLMGGQNTALSFLFMAAAAWGISRGTSGGRFLAGLVLGLWLFKPHFALIVLIGCALFSGWAFVSGALIPAAGFYLLSAVRLGPLWPAWWLEQVTAFTDQESQINGFQMIDLWSMRGNLISASPELATWITVPIVLIAGVTAALAVYFCLRARENETDRKLQALFVLAPAAALLAPHTLFYELAWLVPGFMFFFSGKPGQRPWIVIGLNALAAAFALYREFFLVQPFILLTLCCFILAVRGRRAPASV